MPIRVSPVEVFDAMGKDATLFHYAVDEDEASQQAVVESARLWSPAGSLEIGGLSCTLFGTRFTAPRDFGPIQPVPDERLTHGGQ